MPATKYDSELGLQKIHEHVTIKWDSQVANFVVPSWIKIGKICTIFVSTMVEVRNRNQLLRIPLRTTSSAQADARKKRGWCVRNLHETSQINLSLLAENIEQSFRLGVDVITFYASEELSAGLSNLLYSYSVKPLRERNRNLNIRIIPWYLPEPDEVYVYSQPLSSTDCLMRMMPEVDLIDFRDFDEFIFPVNNESDLNELIRNYYSENSLYFCLHNTRFFTDLVQPNKNGITLILNDSKLRCPRRDDAATKCIVQPDKLLEMNVHQPWMDTDLSLSRLNVETTVDLARMHHFRRVQPTTICHSPFVEDTLHTQSLPRQWRSIILDRLHVTTSLCAS
ncbi:hypothetical protein Ciccas_014499 [Cichlidogyrus casuarinus]|uniref:Glycosyltransferase family 92 protein n=1 Tax=Cichlidogyrus casuarinus TaxID=1844966 RepID=A0ABD2PK78_9PLAT